MRHVGGNKLPLVVCLPGGAVAAGDALSVAAPPESLQLFDAKWGRGFEVTCDG
jgi:hypothetical protein